MPADHIETRLRAAVAKENQLAADLQAAMFKANVTLVRLRRKWVSGSISISISRSEDEPDPDRVLSVPSSAGLRARSANARVVDVFA